MIIVFRITEFLRLKGGFVERRYLSSDSKEVSKGGIKSSMNSKMTSTRNIQVLQNLQNGYFKISGTFVSAAFNLAIR